MTTKLKLYRDKRRLTQAAVAHAVGMSERSYNVHERGKGGACRTRNQDAIAEVLGVSKALLFYVSGLAR